MSRRWAVGLILLGVLVGSVGAAVAHWQAAALEDFERVDLEGGLSVLVPASWPRLDVEFVDERLAEAGMDHEAPPPRLARRSPPSEGFASIWLTVTEPALIHPDEVVETPAAEVREVGRAQVKAMTESLTEVGGSVTEILDPHLTRVGNHLALRMPYRRTGLEGPVHVDFYMVFVPEFTVEIFLSYRESEADRWQQTTDIILASLEVDP